MGRTDTKVAIVTGGSRGIGRAIALALAAAGHRVMLTYRERDKAANEVVAQITAGGGEARCERADVARPEQARALVEVALQV